MAEGVGGGAGGAGGLKFQRALPMRRTMDPAEQEKKLRQAASMYEEQFLREMVKAMRQTVQEGGFIRANQTEKIYREQLDQQYVEKWAAQGGIGLANLIYEQMLQNYGEKMGLKTPIAKPHGPIQLDEKTRLLARPVSGLSSAKMAVEFYAPDLEKPTALHSPWEARILNTRRLDSGETLMDLAHPNGLKSQYAFRGTAIAGLKDLAPGEGFANLDPAQSKSFFWNISRAE